MTRTVIHVLAMFALTMLSACGPIYSTEYQLVPPATESGRYCANACLGNQQTCHQTCAYQRQQCEIADRAQAQRDFVLYAEARQSEGKEIKKSLADFDFSYRCDTPCDDSCDTGQRACHVNCGGQAIPITTCQFNCKG